MHRLPQFTVTQFTHASISNFTASKYLQSVRMATPCYCISSSPVCPCLYVSVILECTTKFLMCILFVVRTFSQIQDFALLSSINRDISLKVLIYIISGQASYMHSCNNIVIVTRMNDTKSAYIYIFLIVALM